MLQAFNYATIYEVISFLDATVNMFCLNKKSADITTVFTCYFELLLILSRKQQNLGWKEMLKNLKIKNFDILKC